MVDLVPLLLAGAFIVLWALVLYILQTRGLLEPRGLQPSPPPAGPFLMWKTVRGRRLIDRIARPARFWQVFGDLSIILVGLTMAGTTLLLAWEATLVQTAAVRGNPPSPDLLLGLPGINPIIPLGYGIFGLSVAIILHEFSHGILSRVAKIKIRSLGLIFLIVPIGAFVEPDEDELRALPRRARARLYAAGPATNILLAVVFATLFSSLMLASVTPVHAGVGIVEFTVKSPIRDAGVRPFAIITAVNGTAIGGFEDFLRTKALLRPGQTVAVNTTFDGSSYATYSVILGSDGSGGPFFGFRGVDTTTEVFHPLTNPGRYGGIPGAVLTYVSLPFREQAPIQEPWTHFYRIGGPLAGLPASLFWIFVNSLYWLFWLNVMLGATNALPAIPLDGGYVFKDGIEGLVSRLKKGIPAEQRDRIVRGVSYAFALAILALVLWQFIGPRI